MKNKFEETEILLAQEHIDVFCISETWIQPQEMEHVSFAGYNISSYYCRKSYLHGGTMILTKNYLKSKEITQLVNLSVDKVFECSAVEIKINNILYCVVCLYRTPDSDSNIFLSKLEETLIFILNKFHISQTIICGDFNIDFLSKDRDTLYLNDLINSYCIYSVFDEPTRTINNSSSAIDYILTSFNDIIIYKNILNTGLSDHSGQKIIIDVNTPEITNTYRFRSFSKNNILKFKESLNMEMWGNVYNSETVENKYTAFHNILHCNYDLCFKFVSKNLDFDNNNNWITAGIKISSIHLRELFILQKNGIIQSEHYKRYKKIYNRVIRQAKKLYFDNIIKNSANKSKTVWKIINGSIKNNINNQTINSTPEFEINDQLITDKPKIVNEINSYFVNLPNSLKPPQCNIIETTTTLNEKSIYLEPVTAAEIIDTINNLKDSNSVGPDDISIKVVKLCAQQIAEPLAHIINECFSEGTFPSFLKLSKIIPLYKKGDRTKICNYRPIAILSVFSKIFEKLLAKRIKNFLESCNILSPNQHGFREQHSTITALINILDFIYKHLDQGHKILGLFIDLSKAFDLVDHDILLNNIECYGIRGLCSKLLKSYLYNRKQFVDFVGTRSKELPIDIGVPQGSVLGPLLFILYTNDLDNCLSTFYSAFADDISIVASEKLLVDSIDKLNTNLCSIAQYLNNKKLVMNQEKTVFMQFHPIGKNYTSSILIKQNNKSIQQVTSHKVLGIHIDHSLDWKTHVSYVCNKCASNCFALKRLRHMASTDTLKIYYFSNLESRFRYGIIFWGYSTSAYRVFVLQKRAIRSMFGLYARQSCKETFVDSKILTLPSLYIFEILKFVKKNMNDFNRQNSYHNYSTRHGSNLQYDLHRLELYKYNPYYMGSMLYNKLCDNIKSIVSVKKFISTVKTFLVSNAFYSVEEFLNY